MKRSILKVIIAVLFIAAIITGLMSNNQNVYANGNDYIIVANTDHNSVDFFPLSANGDVAPVKTIMGTNTNFDRPVSVEVYNNELYVLNHRKDAIEVFNITDSGNAAPKRSIAGGMSYPSGFVFDNGEIYVTNYTADISVYNASDNGNVMSKRTIAKSNAMSVAISGDELFVTTYTESVVYVYNKTTGEQLRTISGENTGFSGNLYGLAVKDGELFVSDYANKAVKVFDVTANGNVAPKRTIAGDKTQLFNNREICIFNGELFVTNQNGNDSKVLVYNVTDNGNVAPKRVITGGNTTFSGSPGPTDVTVSPAPVAPSITTQPSNQTVTAGQTASFTVTVTGDAPLTYQWKKDGNNLSDGGNISGATTATLTVSNAQAADAGSYTCFVSNVVGNVTSNAATLTVNAAPILSATISPTTGAFDKNPANQADVSTTITWNDATSVTDVKKSGVSVGAAVYSVSGNTLTIKKEYMATQPTGSLVLAIEFNRGNAAVLTITVQDTTQPSGNNPPTWPAGSTLTAGGTTKTRTTLSWTAAADDVRVTGYRIFQDNSLIQTVTGAVYSCDVTGLSPSTSYTFKVQAGDADDNWTDGPTVTVRTDSSGGGGGGGGSSAPATPTYKADVSGTSTAGTTLPVNVNAGSATTDLGTLTGDIFSSAGTAVITVPSIPGVNAYTLGIPAASLSGSQGEGALTLATGVGSITIPADMLAGIPGTALQDIRPTALLCSLRLSPMIHPINLIQWQDRNSPLRRAPGPIRPTGLPTAQPRSPSTSRQTSRRTNRRTNRQTSSPTASQTRR
ncbi:MAG: immunoglobulin domain-containing protein, partial [Firmicutes bacterium]|nr:immunoglobulin domain-containing protein [Bacillota bacterium]